MATRRPHAKEKLISGPAIALIYCRVSTTRQKVEGHGLEAQELRCRQYAEQKHYPVEEVFRDDISGGADLMSRPAMVALLDHIDRRPHNRYIVIFDDLSRFARDVMIHLKLRQAFDARDTEIECPNFSFEKTPEGKMVETMVAAQNEYHRHSNKRQVVQKMKARLENGYWTFYQPIGYVWKEDPVHGKLLTPSEKAPIVREALEGYASGRFRTQSDVREFLKERRIKDGKYVHLSFVPRLLEREIYAGWIEYPEWGVARRKGHHEPLITPAVFEQIQSRMSKKTYKRSLERDDFPLRGLVMCSKCGHALTAGWSKGRTKSYAYYRCQSFRCKEKDVRREKLEGEMEELLHKLEPKPEIISLAEAVLKDLWDERLKQSDAILSGYQRERDGLLREKEQLIDKITKTENDNVMRALEKRVVAVDEQVAALEEKTATPNLGAADYGTALHLVFALLKRPAHIWQNGGFKGKRLITKLIFVENPVYDRELAYGTADLSVVIKLFSLIQADSLHDVEMRGIEPRSDSGFESASTTRSFD